MVNIIENWATIEGEVLSITKNPKLPDYYLVEVRLGTSLEVASFPNLAKMDEGKIIYINVKKNDLEKYGIHLNATISCTVRKFRGYVYFIK